MESKKKLWLQLLFLFSVAGITMYCIFQGKDIPTICEYIKKAEPGYIILSVLCVIVFIWGESNIIFFMLRSWGERVSARRCYLYSGIGFFFSCITPSATGGQPAQIYYMKKDNIPIPVSTVILMVITIAYKMVLVTVGVIVVLLRPKGIMEKLSPVMFWCYLGVVLNVFCVTLMCFLVFHPSMARRILLFLLDRMERWHLLRKKEKRREKLEKAMELYQETAAYLAHHKGMVVYACVISLAQRIALFFVTSLTYLAFGLRGESLIELFLLQAMISVAVDMLPLPGGIGISETLFLSIFLPVFGSQLTFPAMLVSRGISYYGQLLISAILTIYAGFRIGRQKKKENHKDEVS